MNRSSVALLLLFSNLVFAEPPNYTVKDLSAISGHNIQIVDMNSRGQLIGYWYEGAAVHGVLYTDGVFESFGALIGDNKNYQPIAINNLGEVLLSDAGAYWLYSDHSLTPLAINRSWGVGAMNDVGMFAGASDGRSGEAFIYNIGVFEFLRQPGPSQPLPDFSRTQGSGINNDGVVIGSAFKYDENEFIRHFFIYESGQMLDIGSAGDSDFSKLVLNSLGHYSLSTFSYGSSCSSRVSTNFGYSFRSEEGPFDTYYWPDNGGDNLQYYSWQCPFVKDINDHDVMVGYVTGTVFTTDSSGEEIGYQQLDYGLLFEAGAVFRLIDYLNGPHGYVNLTDASFINNQGWIVAQAAKADGSTAVVLLQPEGTVSIDVQFWDSLNRVAPASNKFVSVAISGANAAPGDAAGFDVTQIDPASLKFGNGEAASVAGPWLFDTNNDGAVDALYGFRMEDTGTFCEDTSMTLVGETFAREPFVGTDFIQTTDCENSSCHP